jgi:hypothetical protein
MALCIGNCVRVTVSLTVHRKLCAATECCAFGRVMLCCVQFGREFTVWRCVVGMVLV